MSWPNPKIGEIGRFRSENDKHPRFVVVKVLRTVVQIWYSGALKTQTVPLQTFKTDCINGWNVDIIEHPPWLKPKAKLRLDGWITLAHVVDDLRFPRTSGRTERMNLTGHDLEVFSVYHDHAACLAPSLRTIVLVPIKVIHQRGSRDRTRWDRILEDDEFDDYEDFLGDA